MRKKGLIIAIDGPAGSGKSTAARLLAKRLGYKYIDTGSMYRAIACKIHENNVNMYDSENIAEICRKTNIELYQRPDGMQVLLDGHDVTDSIRDHAISSLASTISAQPFVRERLVALQRKMGRSGGAVMEGRDIGTVVFPDADIKFFLDATAEERARRRHNELMSRGEPVAYDKVLKDILKRDQNDICREVAPLRRAGDAVVVDTSLIDADAVVDLMVDRIKKHIDAKEKGEDLNERQ